MNMDQLHLNLLANASTCREQGKALAALADVVNQLSPDAAEAVYAASQSLLKAYKLQMNTAQAYGPLHPDYCHAASAVLSSS